MLKFSPTPLTARLRRCPRPPRRQLSTIAELSNVFLDTAAAIPYPAFVPPYATTIILTTIALRTALLPITIWSRKNLEKERTLVIPAIKSIHAKAAQDAVRQLAAENLRGDRESISKACRKRAMLLARQDIKHLRRMNGIYPKLAFFGPLVIHAPAFIVATLVFYNTAAAGSPLQMESFLTLTSLARPDPDMVLPIVYGCLSFADIESGGWRRPPEREPESPPPPAKANGKAPTETVRRFPLRQLFQNGFRFLAVLRIGIAALAPGSVVIYWLTSSAFNLVQTWVRNWIRFRRQLAAPIKSVQPVKRTQKQKA